MEIVVEVLTLSAMLRPAEDAHVALPVAAHAPDIAAACISQEDVRAEIDASCCALEAAGDSGQTSKVHRGVDGNEHVDIFRHRLFSRQRPPEADAMDARRRSGCSHE